MGFDDTQNIDRLPKTRLETQRDRILNDIRILQRRITEGCKTCNFEEAHEKLTGIQKSLDELRQTCQEEHTRG